MNRPCPGEIKLILHKNNEKERSVYHSQATAKPDRILHPLWPVCSATVKQSITTTFTLLNQSFMEGERIDGFPSSLRTSFKKWLQVTKMLWFYHHGLSLDEKQGLYTFPLLKCCAKLTLQTLQPLY